MTIPIEIGIDDRNSLIPLFKECLYDRVLIDSVLEGKIGKAYADSIGQPRVARLDSGSFTMLAGNLAVPGTIDLIQCAPITYVTPQTNAWRDLLQGEFGSRISAMPFTNFSWRPLQPVYLAKLIGSIPSTYRLKQIDRPLAGQLPSDMGNKYFLENFHSIEDFLARGIGFCILHQDKIVSAATSFAQSSKAIDIEIETVPDYRRRGLGTIVGAKLVSHCLEQGIEPRWLAANPISEKLALKLGYTQGETYLTYEIKPL